MNREINTDTYTDEDREKLKKLFYDLVSIQSDTGSVLERDAEYYMNNWFAELPYFKNHPENFGLIDIPDDPQKRRIVWALSRGLGDETIIYINHHDAIDIEEYADIKEYALTPSRLHEIMKDRKLAEDVRKDLESGDWIFGRATADMKAGAALQMYMLKKHSEEKTPAGNILYLSVADEERLSAGMREAVHLLVKLQAEGLKFKTAINSEPFMKTNEENHIYYEGSVGKIMPVLYARGKKSHIGESLSGFNPVHLLSKIHTEVELNPEFSDMVDGEISPPPTWVHFRDRKKIYDASIPETAVAYFSILSLTSSPTVILNKLKSVAETAFQTSIANIKKSAQILATRSNFNLGYSSVIPRVMTYGELINYLLKIKGEGFKQIIKKIVTEQKKLIDEGETFLPEATLSIIEEIVAQLPDQDPILVLAMSGPIYPQISNFEKYPEISPVYDKLINGFSEEHFKVTYDKRHYFMGISDFSYTGCNLGEPDIQFIESNMPGWGNIYDVPLREMSKLNVPLLNLGPWGKDIHQTTERVYKKDVFERLPLLLQHVTDNLLK